MSLIENLVETQDNPLAVVESMALRNDWSFERSVEDEIAIAVAGKCANYQVSFTWMGEIKVLHFSCSFEAKIHESRLVEIRQLIARINEQLWIGHFDLWGQDGTVMFRHSLLLEGGVSTSGGQCEAVLGRALDACEQYYPAFQFVIWAGKSAREAMDAAMFVTAGHA
jgi:hypothetical protein